MDRTRLTRFSVGPLKVVVIESLSLTLSQIALFLSLQRTTTLLWLTVALSTWRVGGCIYKLAWKVLALGNTTGVSIYQGIDFGIFLGLFLPSSVCLQLRVCFTGIHLSSTQQKQTFEDMQRHYMYFGLLRLVLFSVAFGLFGSLSPQAASYAVLVVMTAVGFQVRIIQCCDAFRTICVVPLDHAFARSMLVCHVVSPCNRCGLVAMLCCSGL